MLTVPALSAARPRRAAPTTFRIALSAVIIDAPDASGVALVADIASGWAFQVSDGLGAPRHRDAGACAGGRDDAMRCALLSALLLVPRGAAIHLALDDGKDVYLLSRLIRRDPAVRTALAGRVRSAAVCPADRDVWQARLAAERVAEQRLRTRASGAPLPPQGRGQPDEGVTARSHRAAGAGAAEQHPTRQILPDAPVAARPPTTTAPSRRHPPAPQPAAVAASVQSWFLDLDASIAALRTGFRGVQAASR